MADFRPPYLGAAYYPEDWPLDQIGADIDLMKQAGMNCMRIGEFAWSRMEPEEGRCDFGLRWADGQTSTGSIWYDGLKPRDCDVLATYTEGPLEGLAAVVSRKLGGGRIVMLGTMPIAADWQRLLLDQARSADVAPVAEASGNLLVVPRVDKAQAGEPAAQAWGLVVVELENRPGTMSLPRAATDLLTGKKHSGSVEVAPYGVMVLAY